MIRKRYLKVFSTLALTLSIASIATTTNVQAASVKRLGGQDRYSTAAEVAIGIFGKCDNVVLVNGQGYADAVSATPLAKKLDAPILLTEAGGLNSKVIPAIKKLGAKNVYIVGGEAVVSKDAFNALKLNGLSVKRYCKVGGSRYDTNAVVARELIAKTGAKQAILVNGQDGYSDALSVASIAAKLQIPVLISSSNRLDPEVKKVIEDNKLKVMAVGGSAVLSDNVVNLAKGERIAEGKDRFKTNISVLNKFKKDLKFDKIYIASGGNDRVRNFADALVGSAAAAKDGSPLILSGNAASDKDLSVAENFVKNNMTKNTNIFLVGSTGVLSKNIENNMAKILEDGSEDALEIMSIE